METAYGDIDTHTQAQTQERIAVRLQSEDATERAVEEYFSDIPVMVRIAYCESTFRHVLSDGSILRGVIDKDDIGVFQINMRYHKDTAQKLGLDLYDLKDNMTYARNLYERKGTQPWSASSACWNRTLAQK